MNIQKEYEACLAGQGIVEKLEQRASQWLQSPYVIAVNSCTTALHSALWACDIKPGDEVICSALDWYSAATSILLLGAIPVFADVDHLTYTLNPVSVKEKLTENTKAIIATHIFGHPCAMNELKEICCNRDLKLIEDCAQALGAKYHGKWVGTIGDIGCFSFGAGKIISAGEGGLIATNDCELFFKMISFCQHPLRQLWEGVPHFNPFSINYRISPQAARIVHKGFAELDQLIMLRQSQLEDINSQLLNHPFLQPVHIADDCNHAVYKICPHIREGVTDTSEELYDNIVSRSLPVKYLPDELLKTLESHLWDRHPALGRLYRVARGNYPVANSLYNNRLVCIKNKGIIRGKI